MKHLKSGGRRSKKGHVPLIVLWFEMVFFFIVCQKVGDMAFQALPPTPTSLKMQLCFRYVQELKNCTSNSF